MLARLTVAGVAGSMLLATAAFAQTQTPAADAPAVTTDKAGTKSDMSATHQGEWRASKMVGLSVYNDKNESVGSINDLLTDKSGNIKAVIIGVGGFLGVGEHLVAVPLDKVKFVNEPIVYTGAANNATGGGAGGARPGGGAATTTTTGAATAPASKPNPWYPDHAVLSGATKDQLKAMSEFKYTTN